MLRTFSVINGRDFDKLSKQGKFLGIETDEETGEKVFVFDEGPVTVEDFIMRLHRSEHYTKLAQKLEELNVDLGISDSGYTYEDDIRNFIKFVKTLKD